MQLNKIHPRRSNLKAFEFICYCFDLSCSLFTLCREPTLDLFHLKSSNIFFNTFRWSNSETDSLFRINPSNCIIITGHKIMMMIDDDNMLSRPCLLVAISFVLISIWMYINWLIASDHYGSEYIQKCFAYACTMWFV